MSYQIGVRLVVLAGFLCGGSNVFAASADQPAPIVGQDVMGDKSRGGHDGFAWAPIPRDQPPSGQAPGQTSGRKSANAGATPQAHGAHDSAKTLPPGEDPGTPAAPRAVGPGTMDLQPSASK